MFGGRTNQAAPSPRAARTLAVSVSDNILNHDVALIVQGTDSGNNASRIHTAPPSQAQQPNSVPKVAAGPAAVWFQIMGYDPRYQNQMQVRCPPCWGTAMRPMELAGRPPARSLDHAVTLPTCTSLTREPATDTHNRSGMADKTSTPLSAMGNTMVRRIHCRASPGGGRHGECNSHADITGTVNAPLIR